MKIKIIINNEEVEITLTSEQIDAITAQQKPKQWEPQGGEFTIGTDGDITYIAGLHYSEINDRLFGTEYKTQAQAEKARDAMCPHNRLLAWLAENDDGWVADWKCSSQPKYYSYLDNSSNKYDINISNLCKNLFTIYMSEQNAKKLCKLLNSGEVVL